MYNDTITERDLLESVRLAAQEILDYHGGLILDVDDVDDDIHEQADGLVNVYTYACMQEWLAVGMPEAEDYTGEQAEGTIIGQVMAGMYYWYRDQLTEAVRDLVNPDEKQAELDAFWSTPTREDEVTA